MLHRPEDQGKSCPRRVRRRLHCSLPLHPKKDHIRSQERTRGSAQPAHFHRPPAHRPSSPPFDRPCPGDNWAGSRGLLGWNGQLFDQTLDEGFILANVSLHWLTGTAGTSIRHYYENTHAPAAPPACPTTVRPPAP